MSTSYAAPGSIDHLQAECHAIAAGKHHRPAGEIQFIAHFSFHNGTSRRFNMFHYGKAHAIQMSWAEDKVRDIRKFTARVKACGKFRTFIMLVLFGTKIAYYYA
jgi:hypothetical protein